MWRARCAPSMWIAWGRRWSCAQTKSPPSSQRGTRLMSLWSKRSVRTLWRRFANRDRRGLRRQARNSSRESSRPKQPECLSNGDEAIDYCRWHRADVWCKTAGAEKRANKSRALTDVGCVLDEAELVAQPLDRDARRCHRALRAERRRERPMRGEEGAVANWGSPLAHKCAPRARTAQARRGRAEMRRWWARRTARTAATSGAIS